MTELRPGDRFNVTTLAAENHPLGRGEVRSEFLTLERGLITELAEEGVIAVVRGTSITDAPGGDIEQVELPDGSTGWSKTFRYELVSVLPTSPHGSPQLASFAAVPIIVPIAVIAAIFGAVAIVALNSLEEIETTVSRVGDETRETVQAVNPTIQVVAVVVLAFLVLR